MHREGLQSKKKRLKSGSSSNCVGNEKIEWT